jgi:hypothetical protein
MALSFLMAVHSSCDFLISAANWVGVSGGATSSPVAIIWFWNSAVLAMRLIAALSLSMTGWGVRVGAKMPQ